MNREPWLAGLCVGLTTLLVVSVRTGKGEASEHVKAAETANDSIEVLTDALVLAESSAAGVTAEATQQDTVVLETVISTTVTIEVARGAAALADSSFATGADSLRAMLDTTGIRILDRIVNDHSVGRLADATAFHALEVRLGETEASMLLWRAASFQKDTVIALGDARFEQATVRGDELEAAYNAEKRKGKITQGVAIAAVVLCAKMCPG